MSKQSKAKEQQGWKRHGPVCANCQLFSSECKTLKTNYGEWIKENNLRCKQGDSKTGKSSWCLSHIWKKKGDE